MSEAPAATDQRRPSPGSRLRLVAIGLVAAILIALIVLASRSSSLPSGAQPPNAGPVIAIIHTVEILGVAVELLTVLLLIVAFAMMRRRRPEDAEDEIYHEPQHVHWAVKLAVIALPLLMLGGLIYALLTMHPSGQAPQLAPLVGAPPALESDGFVAQVSANIGLAWWEILVAVALASLLFVAIVRAFRAPPPTAMIAAEPDRSGRPLAAAIATGLRDARLESDPRRAVIAAYASMEQALAAQGMPRRAVEAPLEYMERVFGAIDAGEAMGTLTELFELARFSHHAISPAMRERAIAALVVIERDLRAAR